jgi:hypothetical protein
LNEAREGFDKLSPNGVCVAACEKLNQGSETSSLCQDACLGQNNLTINRAEFPTIIGREPEFDFHIPSRLYFGNGFLVKRFQQHVDQARPFLWWKGLAEFSQFSQFGPLVLHGSLQVTKAGLSPTAVIGYPPSMRRAFAW